MFDSEWWFGNAPEIERHYSWSYRQLLGSCLASPRYDDSAGACATTSAITVPSGNRTQHHVLLGCGAIGPPLFIAVFLIEGGISAIRPPGYNPLRHPVSTFAIGDFGWLQTVNFLVTGLLLLGFAMGVRLVLRRHHGGIWAPVLIGLIAVGLIGAGVFTADPLVATRRELPRCSRAPPVPSTVQCTMRSRPCSSWGCPRRAAWSATGSPEPATDGGPATRSGPPRCSWRASSSRPSGSRKTPHSCRSAVYCNASRLSSD